VDPLAQDGKELALMAVRRALAVAPRVTLASVVDPPVDHDHPDFSGAIEPTMRDAREKHIAETNALLESLAAESPDPSVVEHRCIWDEHTTASDQLCELAETSAADVIVIPSHGRRGLKRLILGSVAETVAKRSPVAVLLLRP
jgi:nucleotide-binding universal stress UspA family protein